MIRTHPTGQKLEALFAAKEISAAVLDPRKDFVSAELGVSFDGKMIYDRELLAQCFCSRDGMSLDEAYEWIGFNVDCGVVLLVDTDN